MVDLMDRGTNIFHVTPECVRPLADEVSRELESRRGVIYRLAVLEDSRVELHSSNHNVIINAVDAMTLDEVHTEVKPKWEPPDYYEGIGRQLKREANENQPKRTQRYYDELAEQLAAEDAAKEKQKYADANADADARRHQKTTDGRQLQKKKARRSRLMR